MTTGELHKRYKEVMKIAIIGAGRVGCNLPIKATRLL
jgi:hypothetical protein